MRDKRRDFSAMSVQHGQRWLRPSEKMLPLMVFRWEEVTDLASPNFARTAMTSVAGRARGSRSAANPKAFSIIPETLYKPNPPPTGRNHDEGSRKKKAPVQLTAETGFRRENCVAARFQSPGED
jgi:hypothetical protein